MHIVKHQQHEFYCCSRASLFHPSPFPHTKHSTRGRSRQADLDTRTYLHGSE
jgi:hypothetical protein